MDEDPLQRRVYFITFVEPLEIIFSKYTETCEVILDYPRTVGGDIEEYSKKSIRNLLRSNIDVHSRRFISEFPIDGIKCIKKLQSHCANMTFVIFQQVTHKGGGSTINYIKRFHNAHALSTSIGNSYPEDQLMHTFLDHFQ